MVTVGVVEKRGGSMVCSEKVESCSGVNLAFPLLFYRWFPHKVLVMGDRGCGLVTEVTS